MLWRGQEGSGNVEDRRGMSAGTGMALGGGGLGTIVIVILALLFGVDPSALLNGGGGTPQQQQAPASRQQQGRATNPAEDEQAQFVSVALRNTEKVWGELFRQNRLQYREPKLVLFSGQVRSACGFNSAAVGPFYCPGDEKIYIDLSFYRELERRFRAPGDFAQAYVLAHEVGHHIQKLTGVNAQVDAARQRSRSEAEANRYSVAQELQADYYAGVWAHHAQRQGILEAGDIEEALRAASAIGDDAIQKQSQGYVVPDSFTHGSSEQRLTAFRQGFQTGDLKGANAFFRTRGGGY